MNLQTYQPAVNWISGKKLTKDKVVSKEEAHEKNLLHLSAHLLVISSKEKVLCRKRSKEDFRYAGMWTTTIGTHVQLNQNYKEVLINYSPFKSDFEWIGEFMVHDEYENEINGLYTVKISDNQPLDKDFMNDRKFISQSDLEWLIKRGDCTHHLREAFNLYKRK